MKSKKWQRYMGGLMAGFMTFSILGTSLAVPVHAASYDSVWSQQDNDREMEQEQRRHDQRVQEIEAEYQRQEQLQRERDRREQERRDRYDRERSEREHYKTRAEREREAQERQKAHDKKVQTNRTIGAIAAGAIIGAVIAHNS